MMNNDQLDILHFVDNENRKGTPLTDGDLPLMSESFGCTFNQLWEDGYIEWLEVAGEIWFYLSPKGNEVVQVAAGQMALPGMEAQ